MRKRAIYRAENREHINNLKRERYKKYRKAMCQKTREWRMANPDKHREMGKKYRENNRDKVRLRDIKWRYGVTEEQYREAMDRQGGKCAICRAERSGKRSLHVDHCHVTGVFRGLLCSHCNTAIGKFKESTDLLMKAIQYINIHKAKAAS